MASIIKRKKAYSVVYNYIDENGETKQKWETWHTHKEALKRKAEIENQINTGTFLPPNNQKVSDFLYDFVSTYGEKKWGVSMYDSQTALIANYINPIIGDMEVQAITPRVVDKYIQTLQKTPCVSTRTRKASTEFVSNQTIEKIIKLLRCAFKQAVRWELIGKNPFDNTVLPKTEYKKRDIWDADTIRTALDQCTDSKLYVAMNLAFACSLRLGEILGLTWKNFYIGDENIAADNAYVYIEAELTRASKQAIEMLGEKDIFYIFSPLMPNTSTTYKLKLNHGDLKATQGDTGHAEIDMITKVYAHILDEDRKINAQKFESAFYSNPDLRNVKPPQEQPQAQTLDLAALIEQLQKSPELANTLASLISSQKVG